MAPTKGYRRGYPTAILVGLEKDRAVLWRVFSHVVKSEKTVTVIGVRSDPKAAYSFHETIVNAMRPVIREGVRSIILTSPPSTSFSEEFLRHVRSHHAWLMQGANKAVFSCLAGSAATPSEVAALTRTTAFREALSEATSEEAENIVELLEKRLNSPNQEVLVLYSLEEIEAQVLGAWTAGKPTPEYLLLTDAFLAGSWQKGRLQRLMQVASNRSIKTRVVEADSPAGKRLAQLGGAVCILKPDMSH
ncbi:MAG: hypothetical protein ACE14S_02000 [Candidatus Bathyarchaeia archaeon]